jgi:hypothetical protein
VQGLFFGGPESTRGGGQEQAKSKWTRQKDKEAMRRCQERVRERERERRSSLLSLARFIGLLQPPAVCDTSESHSHSSSRSPPVKLLPPGQAASSLLPVPPELLPRHRPS